MTPDLNKLRSRGNWSVRLFPHEHNANRIDKLSAVIAAVTSCHVAIRGWDFPAVDTNTSIERENTYVQQYLDWQHYVEMWRAYKSGQFVSISALYGEWRDQSQIWPADSRWSTGASLDVEDTIIRFVEIFQFAANWARLPEMSDSLRIECTIRGLASRSLVYSRSPIGLRFKYISSSDEFVWKQDYTKATLFTDPRENAIAPSVQLLELFGWDNPEDFIKDVQTNALH